MPVPAALPGNTTGTARGGVSAPEAEARDPREKKVVPEWDALWLGLRVRRKRPSLSLLNGQVQMPRTWGRTWQGLSRTGREREWVGDK